MLGRVEVADGARAVPLTAAKHQALLVSCLLDPGRVVSVHRLVDALWGERPPATAPALVHTYVCAVRRALGAPERLLTRSPGYVMEVGPQEVDVHRFAALAAEGRAAAERQDLAGAVEAMREALLLWRGPAFGGVGESFLRAEATRLEEMRSAVQEERISIELRMGRGADLVPELVGLVARQPLRERPRGQLMTALYRAGRQAEALEVYREGRRVLNEELGLDPGVELQRLQAEILAGGPVRSPDGPPEPVRLTGRRAAPAELPPAVSDFVGRERETAALRRALLGREAARVCVVVGMPGCGKTALAVTAGHSVRADFPDGQLFVDLHGSRPGAPADPSGVLRRLLGTLGIAGDAVPDDLEAGTALFRSVLADRRMLLVLDDAAGERQVRSLLPGHSGCAVLVTSRRLLAGLEGAGRFTIGPLDARSGARLLAETAGGSRAEADPESAARIVELCGGLPLALRAVGARLGVHPGRSLAMMVRRLSDEDRRLDELAVGDLAVRASLESSYRCLSPGERKALRGIGRLGVRPFRVSALAAHLNVPESTAEELAERLAEAQLLEIQVDESGRPRYRCHELLRLYARERTDFEDKPPEYRLNQVAIEPVATTEKLQAPPLH
ncbi:AfsR/SARP family transcriptional regulator [Actinomadura macrotermitis]|uniref:Regulatory protein AfsR n=1 Tax=Actinomadura macrotermitis TaxID=2585200 RepID=A0A7K0BP77_9ACTN|nr:AfsR/SARP family transcriptional regulator [Actinomadura macrotermitis]MQY02998.1 Regulatory protein AfsR [Actinomadura macrotermitis]